MSSIKSECGVEIKVEESPPHVEGLVRVAREDFALSLKRQATKVEEEGEIVLAALFSERDEARALSKSAWKQFRRIDEEVQRCSATRKQLKKMRNTLEKKRKAVADELEETKMAQQETAKTMTELHLIRTKKMKAMTEAKMVRKTENVRVAKEACQHRIQVQKEVDRINDMVKAIVD